MTQVQMKGMGIVCVLKNPQIPFLNLMYAYGALDTSISVTIYINYGRCSEGEMDHGRTGVRKCVYFGRHSGQRCSGKRIILPFKSLMQYPGSPLRAVFRKEGISEGGLALPLFLGNKVTSSWPFVNRTQLAFFLRNMMSSCVLDLCLPNTPGPAFPA